MFESIGAFFDAVGGILSLDPSAISEIQSSPAGLSTAVWILILATLSDTLGNSPLLFISRMRPGRLFAALGIEAVLALIRVAIWLGSFAFLVFVLNRGTVPPKDVLLVIGLGYAPMLFSILVVIPTFGPFIGRLLIAWTLVTMTASIAVANNLSPQAALTAPVVAVIALVVVRRVSDRLALNVLGRFSHWIAGVDLLQRSRALDPLTVLASSDARVAEKPA
jgi:hypothetical protein